MSTALFIVLEKDIPDFKPLVNGKAVGRAAMELDELAKVANVTPLMEFVSMGVDDFEDLLGAEDLKGLKESMGAEGLAKAEARAKKYHSAEEGLKTIQGLRALLQTEPERYAQLKVAQMSPSVAAIIGDLNEYEVVLTKAHEHGVRWQLCMDF